jgi:hypothetical protein
LSKSGGIVTIVNSLIQVFDKPYSFDEIFAWLEDKSLKIPQDRKFAALANLPEKN